MSNRSLYQRRSYAAAYDKEKFGGRFGSFLQQLEVETVLSLMSAADQRILDVGAGTGKLSLPLVGQSRQVTSVDLSFEMIRLAGEKAAHERMTLVPVICDAHQLCFADEAFDCVVASRLMMHLSDWKKGVAEMCRVAKGMIIDVPPLISFGGLDSFFKKCRRLFAADTQTYRAFLVSHLVSELKKRHFQIVAVKRQFFLPLAFHRRLDNPSVSLRLEQWCGRLGLTRLFGAPVTIKAIRVASSKEA
jgi:ubiquinone/menaquinone biosynthesis C-methylase UbiE